MKKTLCALLALTVLNGCVNTVTTISESADNAAAARSASCPAANALGPAYDAPIEQGAVNQALMDDAILHFTNLKRCERGLTPLAADTKLRIAAAGHSGDMASIGFFAHDSPVPGKKKLVDRLKGAGVNYNRAAENIAYKSRIQIDTGRQFYAVDKANCQFSYQSGGPPLPTHSYRSLARKLVDEWSLSPEHRDNLLNPNYRRLGTGGATADNPVNCGDVYITQNFAA